MTFCYQYFRDGKTYFFYLDDESPDTIRVAAEDGTEKRLKVKPSYEWAIASRKTFVYANGGAKGLFCWLSDCVKNDFCMFLVWNIIDDFKNGSRRWAA